MVAFGHKHILNHKKELGFELLLQCVGLYWLFKNFSGNYYEQVKAIYAYDNIFLIRTLRLFSLFEEI